MICPKCKFIGGVVLGKIRRKKYYNLMCLCVDCGFNFLVGPYEDKMTIDQIFADCLKLSNSKRQDYATKEDNHINFKRSAELAAWFTDDEDKVYVILIGTKLARLANLINTTKVNHESIEDTFKDLINYCALWAERRLNDNSQPQYQQHSGVPVRELGQDSLGLNRKRS